MPCACAGKQQLLPANYVLSSLNKHKKDKKDKKTKDKKTKDKKTKDKKTHKNSHKH